jgi:hypothetical protein
LVWETQGDDLGCRGWVAHVALLWSSTEAWDLVLFNWQFRHQLELWAALLVGRDQEHAEGDRNQVLERHHCYWMILSFRWELSV